MSPRRLNLIVSLLGWVAGPRRDRGQGLVLPCSSLHGQGLGHSNSTCPRPAQLPPVEEEDSDEDIDGIQEEGRKMTKKISVLLG
ncbi:Os02g0496201 [Oryza sativa Japonica Group]|uniref:Uncharacterized protein n=2 Tax=Oryza sativa subsp. japonica TaxID=39947 RepID=Q6K934_ORYSJ|nr:hypothetical protein [Oryza sativa Japonica Group]BAD23144.1 hypothetical protein [Oryza sativa Japonica Group]BAS78769.1 Os02g0496201 [Oryza sativa Japonica Group]